LTLKGVKRSLIASVNRPEVVTALTLKGQPDPIASSYSLKGVRLL
jgi:hypothetical protein